MRHYILGIFIGIIFMFGFGASVLYVFSPANAQQPVSDKYDGDCTGNETAGRCADKPFDHSYCQYPTRTTNPADGCDNSDPCDPANTKGGSGDCTPTDPPTVTPAPAKAECGGK